MSDSEGAADAADELHPPTGPADGAAPPAGSGAAAGGGTAFLFGISRPVGPSKRTGRSNTKDAHGRGVVARDAYGVTTNATYQHRSNLAAVLHACLLRRDTAGAAGAAGVLLAAQNPSLTDAVKAAPQVMASAYRAEHAVRLQRLTEVLACTLEVLRSAQDSQEHVSCRMHS